MQNWRDLRRCLTGLSCTLLLVAPVWSQPPNTAFTRRASAAPAASPWAPAAAGSTNATAEADRPLPARTSSASGKNSATAKRSTSVPLWTTVSALAAVCVGLIFALKWIRRHGPAVLRALPNEALEPLGQRVLSRGVAVHLVRCGSRMLVLGVGPDGVRTLAEISDPLEVDLLAGACRRRDESSAGVAAFAHLLQRSAPVRSTPEDPQAFRARYSPATEAERA